MKGTSGPGDGRDLPGCTGVFAYKLGCWVALAGCIQSRAPTSEFPSTVSLGHSCPGVRGYWVPADRDGLGAALPQEALGREQLAVRLPSSLLGASSSSVLEGEQVGRGYRTPGPWVLECRPGLQPASLPGGWAPCYVCAQAAHIGPLLPVGDGFWALL